MLTLGDIRKIDLPDETPVVLVPAYGAWDYQAAKVARREIATDEGEGYYNMRGGPPHSGPDRQVIVIDY